MSGEQDIDASYKIIEWITLAMRKVADDPKMLGKFLFDYNKNLPDIADAFMAITNPEHRGVIGELLKATARMNAEVLVWQTRR